MTIKIAVVTGANRGIGFGVAKALAEKSYRVIMVGRNATKIQQAADELKDLSVEPEVADIVDSTQVQSLAARLKVRHPVIDVLINGAGVIIEGNETDTPSEIASADPEKVLTTLNINTVGAFRMTQTLLPLLKKAPAACIVNISSGMGAIGDMDGGWPGYRMSKAALNALTKVTAAETQHTNIKVNSVCPGWVRTEMGGDNADRSVEEAVPGIIWAAELFDEGPSGGFFRDGHSIEW